MCVCVSSLFDRLDLFDVNESIFTDDNQLNFYEDNLEPLLHAKL